MPKNKKIYVAAVQMDSGKNKNANLKKATGLVRKAIVNGARFILLPEVFNLRAAPTDLFKNAESIPGYSTGFLMDIAARSKVWILAGSISEKVPGKNKAYNTSLLIDDRGRIKDVYRKIHLFDISLNGKKTLESKIYLRSTKPILTSVLGIKTGLAICYDLRFPELFRRYSAAGARILCIPSSFTLTTGEAHWEALLRARAIENQCFVIAPNQYGMGNNGIRAYGNSMIIDPWGKVLARASTSSEEIIYAELDFGKLSQIRKTLPVLKHRIL